MARLGIHDPFTGIPYRRLLRLLYHDLLAGQPTAEAAEEFVANLNKPLPIVTETAGDDEMVATLIADGLARDAHEARAWIQHQAALQNIADPQARAQANYRFATERKARRARLAAERSDDIQE